MDAGYNTKTRLNYGDKINRLSLDLLRNEQKIDNAAIIYPFCFRSKAFKISAFPLRPANLN